MRVKDKNINDPQVDNCVVTQNITDNPTDQVSNRIDVYSKEESLQAKPVWLDFNNS